MCRGRDWVGTGECRCAGMDIAGVTRVGTSVGARECPYARVGTGGRRCPRVGTGVDMRVADEPRWIPG